MALYCVCYRIEHYEDDPAYTLGCEFIGRDTPLSTAAEAMEVAGDVERAVREKNRHAARNYMVKSLWITDVHRLDDAT